MNTEIQCPRVLVVEDDKALRRLLITVFKKNGIISQGVGTGEKALSLLGHKHWDVVICDVCLPGISGESLITKIKSLHPQIQVIIISGFAPDELDEPIDEKLYCDWLEKPFSISVMISKIKQAFEKKLSKE